MTAPPAAGEHLWIIGAGRAGLAIGQLLSETRAVRRLTYSGRRGAAPDHPLFRGDNPRAHYRSALETPSPPPDAILLAVPDNAIADIAARLAGLQVRGGTPVLHLSGALGTDVLQPLAAIGCSVGGLHPLCAIPDATRGAERLRGAWFGLEGEGEAGALAERVVAAAGGQILRVRVGGKPLYHAAAVFASNYAVALLGVAERLMARAGIPEADARAALAELAGGAVANVGERGPAAALTGPIARGDAETVALHLDRLSRDERTLYSWLGREALALAREAGLDSTSAQQLERLLGGEAQ